jgi:hypothetical protein
MPAKAKQQMVDPASLRVMTILEWCKLNAISHGTGKRILKSGSGPKVFSFHQKDSASA